MNENDMVNSKHRWQLAHRGAAAEQGPALCLS